MGAALSEIAGLRLKQKFNSRQVHVHNFGCTRIGNAALAQYLAPRVDSLYRVVHNRDVIPHFPSQAYLYHHSPFEVFWNEQMTEYIICNESGEDNKCSNQYSPNFSFKDHGFYFIDIRNLPCWSSSIYCKKYDRGIPKNLYLKTFHALIWILAQFGSFYYF